MNPSGETRSRSMLPRRWPWLCAGGAVIIVAGLLLPALVGSSAAARPAPNQPAASALEGPGMGAMLGRLVGGTVVVLVLCVVTLYLGRRWLGPKVQGPALGTNFEVLESLALGPRCRVHLVRVGDRQMLAGLDGTGLKALLAVDGSPTEDAVATPTLKLMA